MNGANALVGAMKREIGFMARDRTVLIWLLVVLCLSTIAVYSGLAEVSQQKATIQRLVEADTQDRVSEFSKQKDWGSAAYYSFHLTYDPPSDIAFAALGQRDNASWKHRVRMLALEGQIHEQDAGNPELSLIGRFDFALLAAYILPLVLIVLLHDLHTNERVAGRYNLLIVTAGRGSTLWLSRAFLRAAAVFVSIIVPLLVAGCLSGTAFSTLTGAVGLVFVYIIFWTLVCLWFSSWQQSSSVILTALVGIWVLLSAIVPAGSRIAIDRMVPIPSGSEILMTQREAVNDAWDLAKEDTMGPFLERHPEWANTPKIDGPWDWKWYYAFQQVGDQRAEDLSAAYTAGRKQRDRLASLVSILAPPALLERAFQNLAETDLDSAIAYESHVREFHADLRGFYYPGLFGDKPFDVSALEELPAFGDQKLD